MSRNPEQEPGLRRIELGPVGGRISVLKSALQVAGHYERLNLVTEPKKSTPTTKWNSAQRSEPQVEAQGTSHLYDARDQVRRAIGDPA